MIFPPVFFPGVHAFVESVTYFSYFRPNCGMVSLVKLVMGTVPKTARKGGPKVDPGNMEMCHRRCWIHLPNFRISESEMRIFVPRNEKKDARMDFFPRFLSLQGVEPYTWNIIGHMDTDGWICFSSIEAKCSCSRMRWSSAFKKMPECAILFFDRSSHDASDQFICTSFYNAL